MAFAQPRDSFGHSMLHQSLLPSCDFPFQRSPPLHHAPSPPSRFSSQVEKEAAMEPSSLRKNLRPESLWAQHQQQSLFSAEHVAWAAESGNFLAEEFSVDDLLDFGGLVETEGKGGCGGEEGEEEIEDAWCFKADGNFNNHSSPASALSFEPPPPTEIAVPADDEAELAWLSRFVDDSYTEFPPYLGVPPAPKPSTQLEPKGENRLGHTFGGNPVPCLENAASAPSTESLLVPVKAKRSKRPRGAGSSWSTGVSSSLTTRGSAPFVDLSSSSSTITTSPTSSSCSSSSSSPPCLVYDYYAGITSTDHFLVEGNPLPPPKKQKQKKRGRKPKQPGLVGAAATGRRGGGTAGVGGERRCCHCGVQKTPQWRAGPMGSKTLCNACGVRYKSGRLLPEYRPACSPTFVSHVHSNSHRKVLEMRRKKEEQQRLLAAACTAPVPS